MSASAVPHAAPQTLPDAPPGADWAFCRAMLPRVSRTFALGIRLLPAELSRPVAVAYLICRIADTAEDHPALPVADRRRLLEEVDRAMGDPAASFDEIRAVRWPADQALGGLMEHGDRVLREFRRLPAADQGAVAPWVQEMVRGMASCLKPNTDGPVPLLRSMDDLRRYCWYVAGTVGHLLTGLFTRHISGIGAERLATLERLAPQFGLGLQLTNVIRDIAEDHRHGRSFIPEALWEEAGLRPAAFGTPGTEARAWGMVAPLLAENERCLEDALAYSTALPRHALRVRVFCLTSLFFACRTVALIHARPERLVRGERIKMPRHEVYGILAATALLAPCNWALRALFRWLISGPRPGMAGQGA